MKKNYKKEVFLHEEVIGSNLADLEKAHMALSELLNEYHWDYEPDARKAIEYGTTVCASKNCDEKAKRSWDYINDYKKIMWLASVARDYCGLALENCNKAYCGGAENE